MGAPETVKKNRAGEETQKMTQQFLDIYESIKMGGKWRIWVQ